MTTNSRAFTTKSKNGYLSALVNDVFVQPSRTTRQYYKIEFQELQVHAIWDTGATTTSISQRLAQQLKLIPISKATVRSVNETNEVNVYSVDINLPNKVGIENVSVTEATNLGEFDVLIGMDIINLGDFAITNANKTTYF